MPLGCDGGGYNERLRSFPRIYPKGDRGGKEEKLKIFTLEHQIFVITARGRFFVFSVVIGIALAFGFAVAIVFAILGPRGQDADGTLGDGLGPPNIGSCLQRWQGLGQDEIREPRGNDRAEDVVVSGSRIKGSLLRQNGAAGSSDGRVLLLLWWW